VSEEPAGIDAREVASCPQSGRAARVSRVVPATGATMERRVPVMRLKRVDFPTLGRPTRTTAGPSECTATSIGDAGATSAHLAGHLTP
jgi:hypothetical protein